MRYNDEIYYYIKNNQNDIIGILDSNYQLVAKYRYDSWGNIESITDQNNIDVSNNSTHIANINPFRYRSYYYDIETKLYYLNVSIIIYYEEYLLMVIKCIAILVVVVVLMQE